MRLAGGGGLPKEEEEGGGGRGGPGERQSDGLSRSRDELLQTSRPIRGHILDNQGYLMRPWGRRTEEEEDGGRKGRKVEEEDLQREGGMRLTWNMNHYLKMRRGL